MQDSNPLSEKEGREYEQDIFQVVWKAIMVAARDPETDVVMLRAGEICNALSFVQAMLLATSDDISSPTKIRSWCDDYAKALYRRTLEMKRQGGVPEDWTTVRMQ